MCNLIGRSRHSTAQMSHARCPGSLFGASSLDGGVPLDYPCLPTQDTAVVRRPLIREKWVGGAGEWGGAYYDDDVALRIAASLPPAGRLTCYI